MTLTQLGAFVLVARLGSVRAAAQVLGVSEPAVSQALAALRRHFDDDLISRAPSGMALTPGGQRLMGIASQMVGLGAEAESAVRAAQGAPAIARAGDPRLKAFRAAFRQVLGNLSEQIARDGEGARKLVEVIVEGAVTKKSARKIAMSIANSPLVKTAIAGEDANWGRVVMAIGKAGEPANRDKISIAFNGIRVATKGERDPTYNEEQVSATMKEPVVQIKVSLGLGKGRDRVLTCDLTKEYVAINGDYRS